MGSILAACNAGSREAQLAIINKTAIEASKTQGSWGEVSNRKLAMARDARTAATNPETQPAMATQAFWRKTMAIT